MNKIKFLIIPAVILALVTSLVVAAALAPSGAWARFGNGETPNETNGNGPGWQGNPGLAKNGGGGQTGTKPGGNWPGPPPGPQLAKNGGGGQTGTKPGGNWPGPPPGPQTA